MLYMDSALRISWEKIKSDSAARLELLKKAREVGGGSVLSALYDAVRAVAAARPEAQEAEKEKFKDLLAAFGMEFETESKTERAATESVPAPPQEPEVSRWGSEGAPQAQETAVSPAGSGFGAARPTPQFSSAVAPTPAEQFSSSPSTPPQTEVPAPVPEGLSVEEIKTGVARIREEIKLQNVMAALRDGSAEGKGYLAALNDFNALGDPAQADIGRMRAAYERLSHAAETLRSAQPAVPEPTPVPATEVVPVAAVTPPVPEPASQTPFPSAPRVPGGADPYRESITTAPESIQQQVVDEPIVAEQAPMEAVSPVGVEEDALQEETPGVETSLPPAEIVPEPNAALTAPEVTAGLRELLSGWKLFEKSGWLGFGAHGIEHPLYKKLAPLSVAAVLSGRWEGSDPAALGDIRSYIDGWRDERGVIANPEESFDTYLRRVIAEILREEQARAQEQQAAAT